MSFNLKEIHVFFANKQIVVFNEQQEVFTSRIEKQYQENPHDIQIQTILAQIYYKYENNYILALKMTKEILQQDRFSIDARLDLVSIMLEFHLGSKKDCLNLINECYQLDQNYWRIYFIHIIYYDTIGLNDLFLNNIIKQFLTKFPNNIWIKIYHLQILSEDQSFQLKQDVLQQIMKSEYLDYNLLRRLAYVQMNVWTAEQVQQLLEFGLKLNRKSYICLNNLGQSIRSKQKNNQQCIEYCKRALIQNNRSISTLNNIANSYSIIQNFQESNKYLKQVFEINCYNSSLFSKIAYNYQQLRESQLSFHYLQKGLVKFPNCQSLNIELLFKFFQQDVGNVVDKEYFEIQSKNNCDIQYKFKELYTTSSQLFNWYFQ